MYTVEDRQTINPQEKMNPPVNNTSNPSSPIVFVLIERLHDTGKPTANVLTNFISSSFWYADGDTGCFNPASIWKFDTIERAQSVIELAWDLNKTYLGIAIYDTDHPDEIDSTYTACNVEKMLQVVRNRLTEKAEEKKEQAVSKRLAENRSK